MNAIILGACGELVGTLLAMVKIFGEQVAVLRDMVTWRR